MKTLLFCLSVLFLGLCLVAFRETQPRDERAGRQVAAAAGDLEGSSVAQATASAATADEESLLERLPWLAMLGAWVGGNLVVLAGVWAAWRFYGRGNATGPTLSLA